MDQATLQKNLGAALRERRKALGYSSQESFADAIAMHRAYYSTIERGARNVTLETAARLAAGLGMKLSELLSEAGL
jgi:transcriptional regulator with XRE-family HTH domain